jgi:hypothetical protein
MHEAPVWLRVHLMDMDMVVGDTRHSMTFIIPYHIGGFLATPKSLSLLTLFSRFPGPLNNVVRRGGGLTMLSIRCRGRARSTADDVGGMHFY